MKKKNKKIYITILIIAILMIYSIATISINSNRMKKDLEPKYCLKTINKVGNKITYWGLGYKIVRYVNRCPNEPYKNNIGVKIGSWFMGYELPSKNNENIKRIKTIDDFYNIKETLNKDIRLLPKNYSSLDAQKDNCYIAKKYNLELYQKFMDNVRNKKTSFIRIANETKEQKIVLVDVLYYKGTNKIYTVVDKSRTKSNEDYSIKEFENIGNFEYDNNIYWVVYNDPINSNNINTRNAYVLVKLTQ